jgi:hypothetical protein
MMYNYILYKDYTVFEDNRLSIYPVKLWRAGLALFLSDAIYSRPVLYDTYSSQKDVREFPIELAYLLRSSSKYSPSNVK